LTASVILSEVALEFLALTIIITSCAFGVDQSKTIVLLLVLSVLDGVVPSRELGAEFVIAFHLLADIAGRRLGTIVVKVVSCKV